ncbi:MAG: hypothetical protein ACTSW1_11165 [Candidatus Hodarchaeales archaeon]
MSEIIVFGVITLAITRGIGVLVSLDFLLRKKSLSEKKFYLFLSGWFSWFFSSFFTITYLMIEQNSFLSKLSTITHDIFVLLGSYYLILAILSYFTHVSNSAVLIGTLVNISVPTILLLIFGALIANLFLLMIFSALFLSLINNFRLHRRELTSLISRSTNWLYLTSMFSFVYICYLGFLILTQQGTDISTINDPVLFSLYALISLIVTLLVLVLSIHLEYSLNYIQSFRMKDQYSHHLGNLLQMILNSAEMNDVSMRDLIIQKCEEAKYLINEIREI